MRRVIVALILLTLLVVIVSVDVWQVRANEYFGDGQMYALRVGDTLAGVIRAWGWYAIYGSVDGCRMVPIYSAVGDAAKVECGLKYNEKQTAFRGWYDFRGHPRPFCGAIVYENIPPQCKGE